MALQLMCVFHVQEGLRGRGCSQRGVPRSDVFDVLNVLMARH